MPVDNRTLCGAGLVGVRLASCAGARAWGGQCSLRCQLRASDMACGRWCLALCPETGGCCLAPTPWTAALPEGEVRCSRGTLARADKAVMSPLRICAGKLTSGLGPLGQQPHQFLETLICDLLVFTNTVPLEQILIALYMV